MTNEEIILEAGRAATSYTLIPERNELCNLARAVRENGLIVEIGGLYGGMTAVLGLSNPQARIVVVDNFSWSPLEGVEASPSVLLSNCRRVGVSNVQVIAGDSSEVGDTWNEPIDLLWIDGGQSYERVKSDLDKFASHARRIAVHDWNNADFPSVRPAVEDFLKANPQWKVSHSVEMVAVLEPVDCKTNQQMTSGLA